MITAQLNRYLAQALERSPRAVELCDALEGRRLRLTVTGFADSIWVTASGRALRVARASAAGAAGEAAADAPGAIADVTVSGSPAALLALAGSDASAAVERGSVAISGDEQLQRQFQELARLLRPDLEAALGGVVGRIPAHLALRALASLTSWGRAARDSLTRNTAEYLAHESRDLVPRAEAENFLGGVEALRTQLQRAETRVTQLSAQLGRLAPPDPAPRDPP